MSLPHSSIFTIYWKPSWLPILACITEPIAAPPIVPYTIAISWHFVPNISSSPHIWDAKRPPIIAPAVAPIQSLSPSIFTGREVLIVPYSILVTFCASDFFTLFGDVVLQEISAKLIIRGITNNFTNLVIKL